MDALEIQGGKALFGEVAISGAKNAALPVLIASLLVEGPTKIRRVPRLKDIESTLGLLAHLGVEAHFDDSNDILELNRVRCRSLEAPYDLVRKMRASVLVLGPLLAREGRARVSLPGGCAIGTRPVDFHLEGLRALGAEIDITEGYIEARAQQLVGARYRFPFPSVGATENVVMAATLAAGTTVLENCAREPEIDNLVDVLIAYGASIEGRGTSQLTIEGRKRLQGAEVSIIGDRIEAGTYLCAAMMTRGKVRATGIRAEWLESTLAVMRQMGAKVEAGEDWIEVSAPDVLKGIEVTTAPYPGFPTDMQAQIMAVATVANGTSILTETIFENRFMHVPELVRMGAKIRARGNQAIVEGVSQLKGAPVMATDLRASASLVLAGLAAQGTTKVRRIYHLDRGYDALEARLQGLGASIRRLQE